MDVEAFIHRHPNLFHMAETDSWPLISRNGLLSTTALLNRFGYPPGPERAAIESARRARSVEIHNPATGETAVIRDNKVLREEALEVCLTDMTPTEWYETLNRRTFFWVREERLNRLLGGKQYRDRPHDVLVIDTARLIEMKLERITLAPINTGFAQAPTTSAKRGSTTFLPIDRYPLDELVKRRGEEGAIVELAVDNAVENIKAAVDRVERRGGEDQTKVLWEA